MNPRAATILRMVLATALLGAAAGLPTWRFFLVCGIYVALSQLDIWATRRGMRHVQVWTALTTQQRGHDGT